MLNTMHLFFSGNVVIYKWKTYMGALFVLTKYL